MTVRPGIARLAAALALTFAVPCLNAWPPPHPDHLKPEDNVMLIGKRDVGGGINFYSLQKEIGLGQGLAQQVEQNSKLVTDPVVNEYINRIAQNLVRSSDAKVAFTVKVIQDDSINAFALPGGFFFVNTGLILASNEEDELAGAMAHEIAHVAARHATRNATKGELLQLATIPAVIAAGGGWGGLAAENAASLVVPLKYMQFSRSAEAEADWLGVQYLWKAGYDPNGLVREFTNIEDVEKQRPGLISRAFASHPQTPERIARSKYEITTFLPPRPTYVVDTSEFDQIRARLRKVLAKPVEKGVQLPPPPPPPPAAQGSGDDTPPVLKPPR